MNVFTFRKKLYVAIYFYINLLKIDFEEIKPDIDVQNYCNYIIIEMRMIFKKRFQHKVDCRSNSWAL